MRLRKRFPILPTKERKLVSSLSSVFSCSSSSFDYQTIRVLINNFEIQFSPATRKVASSMDEKEKEKGVEEAVEAL